jgi:hypothetical protein
MTFSQTYRPGKCHVVLLAESSELFINGELSIVNCEQNAYLFTHQLPVAISSTTFVAIGAKALVLDKPTNL